MEKPENGRISSGKYEVEYSTRFEKNVNSLAKGEEGLPDRIEEAVEELSNQPYIGNLVERYRKRRLRKHRVGNFRIIYQVDEANKRIYLMHFRRRDGAYN